MRRTTGREMAKTQKCLHEMVAATRTTKASLRIFIHSTPRKSRTRAQHGRQQTWHYVCNKRHICACERGGMFAGPFWAPKLVNRNTPSTVVGNISLTAFAFQTGAQNGAPKTAMNSLFPKRSLRHHGLANMAAT
jgi:hypothetical protein